MIYGLNFNRTAIPDAYKRKLASSHRMAIPENMRTRRNQTHAMGRLQGVCDTPNEVALMRIQADNGHRLIHIEERTSKAGTIYGVYIW